LQYFDAYGRTLRGSGEGGITAFRFLLVKREEGAEKKGKNLLIHPACSVLKLLGRVPAPLGVCPETQKSC